jgi:hypothetical protein
MRRFMGLLGAAAMLSIIPATPALADKEDGTCSGVVPDASGNLTGAVVFGDLIVRSNKAWTTLTCHYDLTDSEAPAKNTKASGFPCYTPVLTTDTRANASPGGRMVVTCRVAN